MARYLVTGGCGFIGSHLCDRLVMQGHRPRVLDDLSTGKRENLPPGTELIVGTVADPGLVVDAMAGMDGCFHMAAIASVQRSVDDWLGTHSVNLTATVAVFDAARKLGRLPVVYCSSAAVYGDNAETPLRETAATRPLSSYGADKLGCELHARVAGVVHRVPTIGLRFFNVFGPRQDPRSPYSGVISIFADRLVAGRPLTIFGDGSQSRDFVYVGDVVDHLMAAMARVSPMAPVFNVCTGQASTILELARTIGEVNGVSPQLDFQPPRPGDIHTSVGSPELGRAVLGISAKTTLREGLAATLVSLRGGR